MNVIIINYSSYIFYFFVKHLEEIQLTGGYFSENNKQIETLLKRQKACK